MTSSPLRTSDSEYFPSERWNTDEEEEDDDDDEDGSEGGSCNPRHWI